MSNTNMSNYKHQSGHKKRKARELKDEETKRGLRTLFDVGVKKPDLFITGSGSSQKPVEVEESVNEDEHEKRGNNVDLHLQSESDVLNDIEEESTALLLPVSAIENDTSNPTAAKCDLADLTGCFNSETIENLVKKGPSPIVPETLPNDGHRAFPKVVLYSKMKNGEQRLRDWLVWSKKKQSLHCFPCRLFGRSSNLKESSRSVLMSDGGWNKDISWRKLYDKLPNHEISESHKNCYVKWRELEMRLNQGSDIQSQLDQEMAGRTKYWKDLFQRLLAITLFLGERGLPFRGESSRIGDPNNGNFLGIIELLSKYDHVLQDHVTKVKESQNQEKRLQAHYLSWQSQNDFIEACSRKVLDAILSERSKSKYYSILVDATPDCSHEEQLTFILRYLLVNDDGFNIKERFLSFVKCNKKTGQEIANEIIHELGKHDIPLKDCRGQGYDNGANMVGLYKGVGTIISGINPYAIVSNCAAHSLNLCGVNAAECCEDVVTFFGVMQQLYKFFSKSPTRWEILEKEIHCSLHKLSNTRWSARVDAVRPFAKNLPGIKRAVSNCTQLNLTSECKSELAGISKYLNSFKCVLMASIWLKILVSIDHRNKLLQARDTTLDVEISNIDSLIEEMKELRDKFPSILNEVKLVTKAMDTELPTETELVSKRQVKRKKFYDELPSDDAECASQNEEMETREENHFRINVYYKIVDTVIGGLTERFNNAKKINSIFQCLWTYLDMEEKDISSHCKNLVSMFTEDLSDDIHEEIIHLKNIHRANFGESKLKPQDLLEKLITLKLSSLYPNVSIALRIFITLPASVAGAERSFSALKRIKSFSRSTMGQLRLSGLTQLAMESDLARTLDFSDLIKEFARKRARRSNLL